MNNILKKTGILLIALVLILLAVIPNLTSVQASSSTTYTYALNDKQKFVRTQDAYLPGQTITDLGLDKPSDIAIDENDNLVIADTGNMRVIVYDPIAGQILLTISNNQFLEPTGVYVMREASDYVGLGDIFIADPTAGYVFHYDKNGNFIEQFGKPTAIMFETIDFQPEKVAVDKAGILYIISKGTSDGIVQLSNTGEFLGFFASNKVKLTLLETIQSLIYTDEQLANLNINLTPPVFTSVFIDDNNIVYSSSSGKKVENVKKHSTNGTNMMPSDMFISESTLSDIYVDHQGIIYAADQSGIIDVYTNDGQFIYKFGTTSDVSIAGFFKTLSGIAVDSAGKIWTVDSGNNYLQSFTPTEYATTIYEAINLYNQTDYTEAVALWQQVLSLNQLSILAHNGIARNYMQLQEYKLAAEHYKIAGNHAQYSEAFWEIRNLWLQNNMLIIILSVAIFSIVYVALKILDKRYHVLAPVQGVLKKVGNVKILNDVLYMTQISKKPSDAYYYLRRHRKGSYLGAVIIFILTFFSYLFFVAGKGFIFQKVAIVDIDLNSIVLGFIVIIGLFIVCSYLVTSIQDGEGTLGQIFLGIAYSMYPFILACISTTLLSYVATNNEVFLLNMVFFIGIAWTAVLVFLSISEIQNYTFWQTIKSILLTLLFVIVILLVLSFVQMTLRQVFVFFEEIIKEAIYNVFG